MMLIKLMIKTSHTFAVNFHTNPAAFIHHACRHSVIEKMPIFNYHIHILFAGYFIIINVILSSKASLNYQHY